MKGYAGKITYVDLTTGKIWDEAFEERFARKYLGGNGFAARVLFDRVPKGADPLGPENAFILCSGPLNGTLAHGSGRGGVVTKSPLTGYFMDSYFGGEFGSVLKQSGRDMIVLLGKSSSPVALFCDNEEAKLIPADGLWGKSTMEAQDELVEQLGKDICTVCCGPAGEKMVPFACCISGRRAAGRGGTGAVMGSKNLKAVSVRGTKDISVDDMRGLLKFHGEMREKFLGLKALVELGTPFLVELINEVGGLGTRNWQQETWEEARNIDAERLLQDHFIRNWACFGCNLGGCTRVVRSTRNPTVVTEGPEYETLFALGSNCGVDDLDSIIEADRLCDEYGIDTISLGGSIGFLMECFQRGLLSVKDTEGIDFTFGNGETIVKCAHLVGRREGFGEFMCQGVKAMAKKIGQDTDKFACHVRGLEPPGHSARALRSMAISYAVSPRGATHHDGRSGSEYKLGRDERLGTEGKALLAYNTSDWTSVRDSLIICSFCEAVYGGVLGQSHVDLINLTLGWDMTLEELTEIGARIYTLERSFNCREGLRRKDDHLPYRFTHEEIPGGNSKGLRTTPEQLQRMLDDYYELRGWNPDGVPTRQTLEKLGLGDVVIQT
jgi:aldehyde:ferredoxin oxidoreductase